MLCRWLTRRAEASLLFPRVMRGYTGYDCTPFAKERNLGWFFGVVDMV
jgi:hypothetical protein